MATPAEIADAIERLATHCRPPLMTVEQRATWIEDWCSDLGEFPIEAVRAACTRWRHGSVSKFPTAGQMRGLCLSNMPRQGDQSGLNEPWRELSQDEYEALTVRQKIRHHEILAAEAGGKAGPMRLDVPEPANPQKWAEWKPKQEAHFAEAKRLRSFLRSMEGAA